VGRDTLRLPLARVFLARQVRRRKELLGALPAGILVASQKPRRAFLDHGGPPQGIRQLQRGNDAPPEAVAHAQFEHAALAWGRSSLRMADGS